MPAHAGVLQGLGACTEQPSLAWMQCAVAAHLTCAQLRGVAAREAALTEQLLRSMRMVSHLSSKYPSETTLWAHAPQLLVSGIQGLLLRLSPQTCMVHQTCDEPCPGYCVPVLGRKHGVELRASEQKSVMVLIGIVLAASGRPGKAREGSAGGDRSGHFRPVPGDAWALIAAVPHGPDLHTTSSQYERQAWWHILRGMQRPHCRPTAFWLMLRCRTALVGSAPTCGAGLCLFS